MVNLTKRLVKAFRFLDRQQAVVEDSHGNVSCRVFPKVILIKPSGMPFGKIKRDDVCEVRSADDGIVCVDYRRPSVDTEQHLEIYERNPWVMSICHTHSPYATAWAIRGESIPVLCTEHADYFGHPIRCLPYANLDEWGEISLRENERAVLLGKHGTLLVSKKQDPMSVVKLAVALEAVAKKAAIARSLGATVEMRSGEVAMWHERYQGGYGQR